MNILQHWKYFQKTDLNFLHLAYKKQSLVSDLTSLNERRKNIQKEILSLSSGYETCKNCPTSCCRGNYNHFTIVDYVMRMFSDNPIKEFAETQKIPPTLLTMIQTKIKEIKWPLIFNRSRTDAPEPASPKFSHPLPTIISPAAPAALGCPNLTPNGCAFTAEDRPIRCVIYTCRTFRTSLAENDIKKIAALTEELSSISNQAFDLFSK